jgi:hypothetical protein
LWHRKHAVSHDGDYVREPAGGAGTVVIHDPDTAIHMPDPSVYPARSAVGKPIMGRALFTSGAAMIVMLAVGCIITVGALFAWAFEPGAEEGALAHG